MCTTAALTSAPESVLLPLINHLADKYTSEPDEENGIKNKSKERLNLLKAKLLPMINKYFTDLTTRVLFDRLQKLL